MERSKVLVLSENFQYSENIMRCMCGLDYSIHLCGREYENEKIISGEVVNKFHALEKGFDEKDNHSLVDDILLIINTEGIDVVCPTDFESLMFLAKHKEKIDPACNVVSLPNAELIESLDNKEQCCIFLHGKGIKMPESAFYDADDLCSGGQVEQFPVVVKTIKGAGGKGVLLAESAGQVVEFAGEVSGRVQVQEYIDGVDYVFSGFCIEGCIKTWTVFKYSGVGGFDSKSIFAKFSRNEEVYEISERIVSVANYSGPIVIDYRRGNQCGEYYFIEVNPRFGNNTNVSLADGVNFADVAIRLAQGEDYTKAPNANGIWACSLRRLLSAPFRKPSFISLKYFALVGWPQWKLGLKQNRALYGGKKNWWYKLNGN